ncbi:hypothetical protein RMSM_02930 [Rhodopirellula maiorica SM1]|uniref:Uncharacterized protein n=1 Tax=Rhodopirellula maiorica SM1 TaxID=1265738 RepID=M5RXL3_9BACT|nr:hypothetical protein RMSM_02930 [Rhodopirellula maiorica SM1]
MATIRANVETRHDGMLRGDEPFAIKRVFWEWAGGIVCDQA